MSPATGRQRQCRTSYWIISLDSFVCVYTSREFVDNWTEWTWKSTQFYMLNRTIVTCQRIYIISWLSVSDSFAMLSWFGFIITWSVYLSNLHVCKSRFVKVDCRFWLVFRRMHWSGALMHSIEWFKLKSSNLIKRGKVLFRKTMPLKRTDFLFSTGSYLFKID